MSDNLLDPFAALAAVDPKDLRAAKFRLCPVGRAYESLDPEQAKTLLYLVEESGHSAVRISSASRDTSSYLSHNVISVHRRRDCQCPA